MKWLFLFFSVSISSLVFSQQKKDSAELAELLKADYKTMVSHDIKKHRSFCTSDYLLIENGEIWDMNREAVSYEQQKNRTFERKDFFKFRFIRVEGNTAYTVYSLKSDITENGKLTVMNWNESAVFRKVNGAWKIALIHSTPAQANP